ncbi:MAG: preprotein translocase subunit SecG [Porticoccaceae bacterium]|nr:preprotein translocase subunit SecG [Porticoccaceae bacterium]
MLQIVLAIHLVTALAIIGLILIQRGKGAEAGASFGAGASQTIFGSAGSWNFFSKATAILATIFFVTSFTLAVMAKHKAGVDIGDDYIPSMEEVELPVAPQGDIPQVAPEQTGGAIPSAPAENTVDQSEKP